MNWTRRSVLAAGAISCIAPLLSWAKQAGAALWEVRDGSAKVFLFGDGGPLRTSWRSERIEAALNASAAFWKEVPDNGPEATHLFFARGVDPAAPLSTWLMPKERDRVAAAAVAVGTTSAFLERFRPWLAAVFLQSRFYEHFGFQSANGPGDSLTAIAKTAGKPIRTEFPDIADVVTFECSFSRAAEVQSLLRVLDSVEDGADFAERWAEAWAAGDQRFELQDVRRMIRVYPELYQEYVVARNRRWPGRIRTMLDGGGTTFVILGGGHLVGSDCVQNQLAAVGMRARRV
jgi:uncharacterized protein YbaP (TraB family)